MSAADTEGAERNSAAQHHELDERLHELTAKHYLSEPEQVEEVTLKKRKLQVKDRMEDIRRQATDNAYCGRSRPGRSGASARPPFAFVRIDRPVIRSSSARWSLRPQRRSGCRPRSASRCWSSPRSSCSSFAIPSARRPPVTDNDVLSPADGRVLVAGDVSRRGAARIVAAGQHLSLADGRAREPRAGVGPRDARDVPPGRFLPAYRHDAGNDERAQRDLDRSRRPADRRASDRRDAGAARRVPARAGATTCARAIASAS